MSIYEDIKKLKDSFIADEVAAQRIDKLIASEKEAIQEYKSTLNEPNLSNEEKEMLEEILKDEEDHLKMLENYKQNGKAEILDSCVKDGFGPNMYLPNANYTGYLVEGYDKDSDLVHVRTDASIIPLEEEFDMRLSAFKKTFKPVEGSEEEIINSIDNSINDAEGYFEYLVGYIPQHDDRTHEVIVKAASNKHAWKIVKETKKPYRIVYVNKIGE